MKQWACEWGFYSSHTSAWARPLIVQKHTVLHLREDAVETGGGLGDCVVCSGAKLSVAEFKLMGCVGAPTPRTAARGADLSAHCRWISSGGRCLFSSQCVSFAISRILAIWVWADELAMVSTSRRSHVKLLMSVCLPRSYRPRLASSLDDLCRTLMAYRR